MSCELVVDVDVPYEGDKIVLNAIQGPPGPWTVELTMSKYILDDRTANYDPITTADVTIYEEDGTSYSLTGVGFYTIDKHPQEGSKYRIVARADGFRDVDAEMTVPRVVKIIDVEWDSTGVVQKPPRPDLPPPFNFNSYRIPIKVTFTDPPGVKNFYAIMVYLHLVNSVTDPETQEIRKDSLTSVTRTWIDDPAIAIEDDRKMRFSDNAFEGTTYTANMIAQLRETSNQELYRVDVVLVSLSEEYFRYEESREVSTQNEGDPFAQPVQTYSNVNNGLGIFAGYAMDEVSWDR